MVKLPCSHNIIVVLVPNSTKQRGRVVQRLLQRLDAGLHLFGYSRPLALAENLPNLLTQLETNLHSWHQWFHVSSSAARMARATTIASCRASSRLRSASQAETAFDAAGLATGSHHPLAVNIASRNAARSSGVIGRGWAQSSRKAVRSSVLM